MNPTVPTKAPSGPRAANREAMRALGVKEGETRRSAHTGNAYRVVGPAERLTGRCDSLVDVVDVGLGERRVLLVEHVSRRERGA